MDVPPAYCAAEGRGCAEFNISVSWAGLVLCGARLVTCYRRGRGAATHATLHGSCVSLTKGHACALNQGCVCVCVFVCCAGLAVCCEVFLKAVHQMV